MSVLAVALVFVHSLFAVDELSQVGQYFNCSKISGTGDAALQAKTNCIATGWCFWSGSTCYYDNCLKAVSKADYEANDGNVATLCTDKNGQGSIPNLYYLTEVHACVSPCAQTDVQNIYCRETNGAFQHNVIDECFYADLKYRAETPDGDVPKVENSWCKVNDTYKETGDRAKSGFYVYADNNVQDCSTLSDQADVCDCLGTEWCNLHPRCTLNKAKNACIKDPCSDNAPGATTASPCTPDFSGCTTSKDQQKLNVAGTAKETYKLCVSTSSNTVANVNNDTNECFYLYAGFVTPNAQCPYPECASVSQVDKCTSGFVNKDDGTVDQETPCTLADLPGGYFPTNKYCNDGRKVPVIAAASLVQMPLLLVFVGLLALFI